jgi:hypothetical protein
LKSDRLPADGQEVPVKVLEVDRQGRVRLSIKEATEQSQPAAEPEAPQARASKVAIALRERRAFNRQDALLAPGTWTFIQSLSSGVGNEAFFALVFRCDSFHAGWMQ